MAQREVTAKYYVGVAIELQKVRLIDIHDDVENGTFTLTMKPCDEDTPPEVLENRVYCTVRKELFPRLKGMREDMKFWISGQISDAGSRHIELRSI